MYHYIIRHSAYKTSQRRIIIKGARNVIHVLSGAALKYNPATLLVSELLSIVVHDYDVMLSIVLL